jgi:hypothetical protein
VLEAFEYEDTLDVDDIPEHDRKDNVLAVSGVASRFGVGEGVRETLSGDECSFSVLMMAC